MNFRAGDGRACPERQTARASATSSGLARAVGAEPPASIAPGLPLPWRLPLPSPISQAFQRADQIQHAQGKSDVHWFAPIVADAEAGFGGNLNAYELMRAMIKVGARLG